MNSDLVARAEAYARKIFSQEVFKDLKYHNLKHTQEVVQAAEEIGAHSGLTDNEMESALLAAWFHDIGYAKGAKEHEQAAADEARDVLTEWGVDPAQILEVTEAIKATRMPQRPLSIVSKVVCDADLYHLSTDKESLSDRTDRLRAELETHGKKLNDKEWMQESFDFMKQHKYHTPYGRAILEKRKKKNIKKIKKKLKPEISEKDYRKVEDEVIKLRTKLEKQKTIKPDRGIETMFRLTSHNHLMLSSMADNKANILITINSIVLSVVVSVLVRKLEENPALVIPTVMLTGACLATMVFAILSTRPTISQGRFSRDDIKNKRTNLLFFGNFHGMEVENYEWAMKEMMKDGDYLYGSLIKDIYYLGKVLGKKYWYLRISYNIFMFGFVLAVLAFIIVALRSDTNLISL